MAGIPLDFFTVTDLVVLAVLAVGWALAILATLLALVGWVIAREKENG